jgi:hypothetical protein
MFNIKKNRLSLVVTCTSEGVQIDVAPDSIRYTPLVCAFLKSERAILKYHLLRDHIEEQNVDEESLMVYYSERGYTVTHVPLKWRKDKNGEWQFQYR